MTQRNPLTFKRIFVHVASILLTFSTLSSTHGEDARTDIAGGKALLKEGDEAADRGEFTDAVVRYKRAFEKLLPGMRQLPFKQDVKRDVTARENLKALLIKEIDEDMTPAEFRADELGMKALGLLPPELDLKQVMVKIYSEEIAAFYDPRTKTMHLIKEPEQQEKKPRTLLEKLMGKSGGFDKEENKTVIAHELTHALADQNFDIAAMQKKVKSDDDKSLALSALIEGEATLTMIGAQMQDWNGSVIRDVPASSLNRIFSLMIPLMPLAGGKSLREAPAILSETMIFPYLRGMVFCAKLTNDGGWDALTQAYLRPPLSTEQILHPEKYRAEPDPPTSIDLGKVEPGEGWKEIGRNVVGEMQLGVLLRRHGGKVAAAGWDGDCYAVFEDEGGRLGIVWSTTWDTEDDAREFHQGYSRFQTTKLGEGATDPETFLDVNQRQKKESSYLVERRGRDVVVVEGFAREKVASLAETAFQARKSEASDPVAPSDNSQKRAR
ncbi:MAG: hypothetical protein NVSMB9_04830 [Isosphaeraceae bacterium]